MSATHCVPPFAPNGPDGTQLSLCGAWVDPLTASTEPTCPACVAELVDEEETARALEAEFKEFAGKLVTR